MVPTGVIALLPVLVLIATGQLRETLNADYGRGDGVVQPALQEWFDGSCILISDERVLEARLVMVSPTLLKTWQLASFKFAELGSTIVTASGPIGKPASQLAARVRGAWYAVAVDGTGVKPLALPRLPKGRDAVSVVWSDSAAEMVLLDQAGEAYFATRRGGATRLIGRGIARVMTGGGSSFALLGADGVLRVFASRQDRLRCIGEHTMPARVGPMDLQADQLVFVRNGRVYLRDLGDGTGSRLLGIPGQSWGVLWVNAEALMAFSLDEGRKVSSIWACHTRTSRIVRVAQRSGLGWVRGCAVVEATQARRAIAGGRVRDDVVKWSTSDK